MANIILHNEERKATADRIMKQYGADKSNPDMREAAEVMAARTHEAIEQAHEQHERRYY